MFCCHSSLHLTRRLDVHISLKAFGHISSWSGVVDVACGVAMWEQFRNWLYLIGFKPYRLFSMRPFESNQIEAIRLFKISSNGVDHKDCPSEPSKGAITDHPYATAYQKQVVLHSTWNSSFTCWLHIALHLTCFYAFDRKNRIADVMQRIEEKGATTTSCCIQGCDCYRRCWIL